MIELVTDGVVVIILFLLSFGFSFWFPGTLIFVAVNLVSGNAGRNPPSATQFFSNRLAGTVLIRRPC